jgi:SAM-dependent methyltransferase
VATDDTSPSGLAHTYDATFFSDLASEVRASAEVVVPIVVAQLAPKSVLDVGCGQGTWLSVFRTSGVADIVGVDGPHISPSALEIPVDDFVAHDLDVRLDLDRRFDLAVCLEVAEHLDVTLAPTLVASLVAHAPVVLFSAAIPSQGGAGHVNERWPSYWADLFRAQGYVAVDLIRPLVWNDERVAFWYAQNTILYVDSTIPNPFPVPTLDVPLDLVHPRLFLRKRQAPKAAPPSLQRVLRDLPGATRRAVSRRFRRPSGRKA